MAKKTQIQLLEEIVELLTPVANMAKYNIQQINNQIAEQDALMKLRQEQFEAQKKEQAELKKVEE